MRSVNTCDFSVCVCHAEVEGEREKGLLEVQASEEAVTVGHVSLGAVLGGFPHSSVPLQCEIHEQM